MTSQPPQDEVEEVARAICGPNCDAPTCSCQPTELAKQICWQTELDRAHVAIATIDRLRRAIPAAARIGTAADIGCSEPYSCQRGRGDPPMDCIWPECPCGTLVIKPEYRIATPMETEEALCLRKCARIVRIMGPSGSPGALASVMERRADALLPTPPKDETHG